jgi:hypothetical protein
MSTLAGLDLAVCAEADMNGADAAIVSATAAPTAARVKWNGFIASPLG